MGKILKMKELEKEAKPPSREWSKQEIKRIKDLRQPPLDSSSTLISSPSGAFSSKEIAGVQQDSKIIPMPILASLTDTSGSPSESINYSLLATIKREWQHQLRAHRVIRGVATYLNPMEPTFNEIIETEKRVKENLYGI